MKAPLNPTRFHTPVKHYHRVRLPEAGWDSWIGEEKAAKKAKSKVPMKIGTGILVIVLIAAAAYFLA